jgi:hypothetical protein
MKSKTYNGEVRSSEKDFETLQLGAFAAPGLLLAQGPVGLTAESGFKARRTLVTNKAAVCDSHGSAGCKKGKARPRRLAGTQRLPSLAGM